MDAPVCCVAAGAPFPYNYVGNGSVTSLLSGDTVADPKPLSIYTTGNGSKAIILIPDIWGLAYPQVINVADRLAAQGFSVAVVDIYRFNTWPYDSPPDDTVLSWASQFSPSEMLADVANAVDALKIKTNATSFGVFGFCYGAYPALLAGQSDTYKAVGGAHPFLPDQGAGLGSALKVPVALLPALGDDINVIQNEVLANSVIAELSVFQFFDENHGFLGARGDFYDPKVVNSVTLAVDIISKFFNARL